MNKIEERIKKKKQEKDIEVQVNFKVGTKLKTKCAEILKERDITLTDYLTECMEVLAESKK